MTENEENESVGKGLMSSKFWRTLFILLSVFLIFAGPTYVIYALAVMLQVDFVASFAIGFALLVVGLVLMWYLVKKKVIE